MQTLTSIFSGPCIFSWAAKAFLKGVGVLGVGIMTVLWNLGVLELESWQSLQIHLVLTIRWKVSSKYIMILAFIPAPWDLYTSLLPFSLYLYLFTHHSLSGAWVWFLCEAAYWGDIFGHTQESRWGLGYPNSDAPPRIYCRTGGKQTSHVSHMTGTTSVYLLSHNAIRQENRFHLLVMGWMAVTLWAFSWANLRHFPKRRSRSCRTKEMVPPSLFSSSSQ